MVEGKRRKWAREMKEEKEGNLKKNKKVKVESLSGGEGEKDKRKWSGEIEREGETAREGEIAREEVDLK